MPHPSLTKTETLLHLDSSYVKLKQTSTTEITIELATDQMGPVKRPITNEERRNLMEVLDARRDLAAGWDAQVENKLLREKCAKLEGENRRLKRVLRIFREFVDHGATQWKMGTHKHPMWEMISETLGAENSAKPSQAEWTFIYPLNQSSLPNED